MCQCQDDSVKLSCANTKVERVIKIFDFLGKNHWNVYSYIWSTNVNIFIYLFIRVPRQGQIRKQWIKAISKHQEFDYYSLYYLVCHLHFKDDDFKMRKDKLVIKKNAVPSIFSPLDCHRGRKKPAMSTLSSEDAHESAMQNETGDCDEIEPISGDQYNFVSIPSHPLENQIKIECQPTIYDPVEMPSPR